MNKELEEIVMKQLNAEAGQMLRAELEELDERRKQGKKDALNLIDRDNTIKAYKEKTELLEDVIKQGAQNIEDSKKILERETALSVKEQLIAMRENHSECRVSDMKETIGMVFRNSVLRKSIMTQDGMYFHDSQGRVSGKEADKVIGEETVEE